jgi:hypothetical protein
MFSSFIQAGFECATHRNLHGTRLDIVAATRHDNFIRKDYTRTRELGIATVREGARWHIIEREPGHYDFSTLDVLFDAAQAEGVQIILDLMHFGWPDFLDVFSSDFVHAFKAFAFETSRFLKRRSVKHQSVIPINEISFLSWAGGDRALLNPHERGRGAELKRQLVRAAIAASSVLRTEVPGVCLASAEPVIHIVGRPGVPGDELAAERHRLAMYEATDMLTGRSHPELSGRPEYLDVVGVNFYDRNQWINHSDTLTRADAGYRPFHQILREVWDRYRKPVLISETGTEDDARPEWFEYVSAEVRRVIRSGIPVEGICLYPILNHPGWDDDRHCCNGLWDYANGKGEREIYAPLAAAIARQQQQFALELERVA